MPRRFLVELLGEEGAIERHPMKQWVRMNPRWLPPGQEPETINSHSVRNLLKKHGWGHRVTDAEETLVSPEVMRTAPEEPSADEEEFAGAEDHAIDNGATFAYESHLRDFLANHLEILEPGLTLWGRRRRRIPHRRVPHRHPRESPRWRAGRD